MNLAQKQLDSEWSALRAFEKATEKENTNHWMRYGRTPLEGKQKLEFIAHYKFQLFMKFDPNQPRDNEGRWHAAGGSGSLSQDDTLEGGSGAKERIDLHKEEAKGGHTILHHVGKSDDFLKNRVQKSKVKGLFVTSGIKEAGSFSSLQTAEKLINSTIDDPKHFDKIQRLVSGKSGREELDTRFNTITGREAFVYDFNSGNTFMRDVDAVRVVLYPNKNDPNRYFVKTAFPIYRENVR